MSPREIATRLRYESSCLIERAAPGYRRTRPDDLRARLRPEHRRGDDWATRLDARRPAAARRYFAASEGDYLRRQFASAYQAEQTATLALADDAVERRITFFGRTFAFNGRVPWNADPVTGREWPRRYHRGVPIHGGGARYGDVKDVWELNRQQFLIDLAKAWLLTHDTRYWQRLCEYVFTWIEDNPYGVGVNWACALEPAFRSFSWLWAYHLCADAPLERADHLRWLASFHDHGTFLFHHLEHYASPYNHLIGEAAALYMLGVLFPEFAHAEAWRARGRHVLESEVARQFFADGGSVEQSTFYHHATLGFYLLASTLGRVNGERFSPEVDAAIERGIAFSMALQQPDGSTPRIGGADDGKPLRMEQLPLWDFRFFQAIGAVIFGRGDFKHAAGRFYEDALWMLGEQGARAFDRLEAQASADASRALPASGYYVLRTGWHREADYVCFDCGVQAAGLRTDGVPSAAHGHADCLAVLAWLQGRAVLVDSGVFTYNGERPWIEHFRRTAAHNTVRVDGRDQAEYGGKMNWSRTYRPQLQQQHSSTATRDVTGSHDGYRRLADPVDHIRTVVHQDGLVVIRDEVRCNAAHRIELVFQLAPGSATLLGDGALLHAHATLGWGGTVEMTPALTMGGSEPDAGWIAESLGVRTPAPRLCLSADITAPGAVLLTVLSAQTAPEHAPRRAADVSDGVAAILVAPSPLGWRQVSTTGLNTVVEGGTCPVTINVVPAARLAGTASPVTPLEPSCR